jgi:hypothetical protein
MIYFIHAPILNKIKIGYSKEITPLQRLEQLQVGSPEILKILGCIDGNIKDERHYQSEFRRFHSHLEWYNGDCLNQCVHIIKLNFHYMDSLPYSVLCKMGKHMSVFEFLTYKRSIK